MKLILLVCLVGTAYSSEQETINGHLDFTHSDRSLNEYYPDLKTAIELPVLRYTYDWRDQGLEDSLVIPLYDCTSDLCSKCIGQETALLVEVKDWELVCQVLPFHVTMVEQRSTGTEEEADGEAGNASLQQSNGELTGSLASSSSTAVLAGLQAQNTAEDPEEETEEPEVDGPTPRSLDAASATTEQPTAAPAASFLPDINSNEADQSSDAATEATAAAESTEAPAAAPKAVPTTTKATTTTEASTEAANPSIVTAAIEPKEADESEDIKAIEATTEAINSPTEAKDTEAAEIQDDPESDVGLHDDDFTLEPEEKSSSDHQTETDEDKKQEDHDEDVEVASDEPSSNGEKEHEPDQIHLSEGVRSDEGDDWRAKYYTILGFFICFLIVFVIVVLFVIIKMKQRRAAPPTMIGATTGNVSPGPALERSFHTGDENEPLTPAVPAGASHSTFKFDGTKTHTPLPR